MNKDIKQQLLLDQNIPDEQKQAMLAQRKMLGGIIKKDQPLYKNIISVLIFIIVIPFILISELYEAICYYAPKAYDLCKRIFHKTTSLLMKGIQNIYNFIIFVNDHRQQLCQSLISFILSALNLIRVFWYQIYSVLLRIADLRLILYAKIYKICYFSYQVAIKPIAHFLVKILSFLLNGFATIIMKNMHHITFLFKQIQRVIILTLEKTLNFLEYIIPKLYYFTKKFLNAVIEIYQLTTNLIKSCLNFIQKQILVPIKTGIVGTFRFLHNIFIIKPKQFFTWLCHKLSEFKKRIIAYFIKQIDRLILATVNLISKIVQSIIDFGQWLCVKMKIFGKYLWRILVIKTNQIKQFSIKAYTKFIYDPIIALIHYSKQASIFIADQIAKYYKIGKEWLLKFIKLIKDTISQMIHYLLNKFRQGCWIVYNKVIVPILEIIKQTGKYVLRQIKSFLIYFWKVLVYKKNQIKQISKLGYHKVITLSTTILNHFIKTSIFCLKQILKYYQITKQYLIQFIIIIKDNVTLISQYLIIKIRNGSLIILDIIILPLLYKIKRFINFMSTAIYNIFVSLKNIITTKIIILLNNLLKFMNFAFKITQKIYCKSKDLLINKFLIPTVIKIKQFCITIFNKFLTILRYIRYHILRPKISALRKLLVRFAIYCLDQILRFLIYFQSIKQQLIQTIKSILYNITIRPFWWLLKLLWKIICILARFIKRSSIRVFSIMKKTHHLVVITALQIKIQCQRLLQIAIIQIKAIYQKESLFYVMHIRPRIQKCIQLSKEIASYLITNCRKFMNQTKLITKRYYEMATQQFKIGYGILKQETIRIAKVMHQNIKEFISIMIVNLKLLKAHIQQIWTATLSFIKYHRQKLIAILKILKQKGQIFLIEMKHTIQELIQTVKVSIIQFYQIAKQNMIILRDLINSFKNMIQQQFQQINDSLIKPIVENLKQQSIAIKLYIIQIKDSIKETLIGIQQSSRQMRESMKQQLLEQKQILRDKKNQLKVELRAFKQSFKKV